MARAPSMMLCTKEGDRALYWTRSPYDEEVFMSEKLSPRQAAKYLGFSVPTLERWRRSGVGPKFVKLGGNRVAYLQKHLDEYVESRVQTPALEGQP